jgi:hypothetical protein
MYVRWVVRKHKNASVADMTFHDAYLVESYRDEEQGPRQRTICYLGNIRQIGDEFPVIEREIFLLRADRILSSLPEVPPEEREQVINLLRQKVPELTHAQVLEAFRGNLAWYFRWWAEHGGAPSHEDILSMIEEAEGNMKYEV